MSRRAGVCFVLAEMDKQQIPFRIRSLWQQFVCAKYYKTPRNSAVPARKQFDENPTEWGNIPLIGMRQKFSIPPKIWIITLQKSNGISNKF